MKRLLRLFFVAVAVVSITTTVFAADVGKVLGAWSTVTPAGTFTARDHVASFVYNNRLYVVGGRLSDGTVTGAVEVYNPTTNTWENNNGYDTVTVPAMPTARKDMGVGITLGQTINSGPAAGIKSDWLVVCGGTDASGNALSTCEVLDLKANVWYSASSTPAIAAMPGAIGDPIQFENWVLMTVWGSSPTPQAYTYDVRTNAWITTPFGTPDPMCYGACGMKSDNLAGGVGQFGGSGGPGGNWMVFTVGGNDATGAPTTTNWRARVNSTGTSPDQQITGVDGWVKLAPALDARIWASSTNIRPKDWRNSNINLPIIVGGNAADGTYPKNVMAFMSGPFNYWQTGSACADDMPEGRGNRPALGVINNTLYVVAGSNESGFPATILKAGVNTNAVLAAKMPDVSNRLIGDFERIADIPEPTETAASAVVDGKLYVIGGNSAPSAAYPNKHVLNNCQMYDPATNTWTQMAPMPWPAWRCQAGAFGTKIYVAGGQLATNPPAPWPSTLGNRMLQIYDTVTNTWVDSFNNPTEAPMMWLSSGQNGVCATSDGSIHAIGGRNSTWNDPEEQQHERYDIATKTWYVNNAASCTPATKPIVLAGTDPTTTSPSIDWTGRRDIACQEAKVTNPDGTLAHDWLYWFGGGDPWTQQPQACRFDVLAGAANPNPSGRTWGQHGWVQLADLPSGRSNIGHFTLTTPDGIQRIAAVGGDLGGLTVTGSSPLIFVYHDPDEGVTIGDSWTLESIIPGNGTNGNRGARPQCGQIGNYVYVMTGNQYQVNPVSGKNENFATKLCYRAPVLGSVPPTIDDLGKALALPNGRPFYCADTFAPVVTRSFTISGQAYFWIESSDRSSAVRVGPTTASVSPGNKVTFQGLCALGKDAITGERTLKPGGVTVDTGTYDVPKPVAIGNKSFIGKPTDSQAGRPGAFGLNNVGMLARIYGNVTAVPMSADSIGFYCYIDDGSGLADGTINPDNSTANVGIRVYHGGYTGMDLVPGKTVSVGGIVTLIKTDDGKIIPALISDELTTIDSANFIKIY